MSEPISSPIPTRFAPAWLSRGILAVLIVVAAASLIAVMIALPDGSPTSSDPGAPKIPTWVTLLPVLVGIALTLVVPPQSPTRWQPVQVRHSTRLWITTLVLFALAIALPVLVGTLRLGGEDYVLAKFVTCIVLPAVLVLSVRRALRIETARGAWRWWAPVVVLIGWALLAFVAPWNPGADFSGYDRSTIIIAATATAITAGFGEEFFYRRLLQTRLEAILGPWAAIGATSTIFALMHLGSHGTGDFWLDAARVIVAQGSFGVFMGVLWWRYRNLTMNVVAHVLANGWLVGAYLLFGA